jgi:hypothetical protein
MNKFWALSIRWRVICKDYLTARYNPIRIKISDEWKLAFHTRYGYYEYLVILFRMANALLSFQNIINKIFKNMINLGIIA